MKACDRLFMSLTSFEIGFAKSLSHYAKIEFNEGRRVGRVDCLTLIGFVIECFDRVEPEKDKAQEKAYVSLLADELLQIVTAIAPDQLRLRPLAPKVLRLAAKLLNTSHVATRLETYFVGLLEHCAKAEYSPEVE